MSGKAFSIIKSFLTVVVNNQSLEIYVNNASIPLDSLFNLNIFLLYINDRFKNICQSLVTIYTDDTIFYRCTSKTLDDL